MASERSGAARSSSTRCSSASRRSQLSGSSSRLSSPLASCGSRKWFVCSRTPSCGGPRRAPRAQLQAGGAVAVDRGEHRRGADRPPSGRSLWPRRPSSPRRGSAGRRRGPARRPPPPSEAWWRMFMCTPRPALLTPILPTIPYSVSVRTTWPGRSSHTNLTSSRCSCQSQVCSVRGGASAGSSTTVEHSPRPRARISVRALSAAICQVSRPAPEAMPSISAARRGAHACVRSSVASAISRTSAPQTSKSRS